MFSDPQFWVAIAFFLFILAIFNPVRKILLKSLDQKILEIKNKIDEAEKLKNDAKVTLSQIEHRQNKVQNEIKLIHEEANSRLKNIEETFEQKLKDQIEKKKELTLEKINQLTRDANMEIQNQISSSAIQTTYNLLEKKLDDNEKQNLIDSSLDEINSSLKN